MTSVFSNAVVLAVVVSLFSRSPALSTRCTNRTVWPSAKTSRVSSRAFVAVANRFPPSAQCTAHRHCVFFCARRRFLSVFRCWSSEREPAVKSKRATVIPARSIASSCSTVSVKGPPMVTTTLHLSYRIASGRSRRDVDRTCSLSVPPSKFLRRPFVAYLIPPPAVFTCDLTFMDPMAGRRSLVAACAEDSTKTRCYLPILLFGRDISALSRFQDIGGVVCFALFASSDVEKGAKEINAQSSAHDVYLGGGRSP